MNEVLLLSEPETTACAMTPGSEAGCAWPTTVWEPFGSEPSCALDVAILLGYVKPSGRKSS